MPDYDIEVTHDIVISRGRTLREPFGFYTAIDASGTPVNPVDLTGFTFNAELKKSEVRGYPVIETITVTVKDGDPVLGEIFLGLTDTETAAITEGEYRYDLMVTTPDGKFNWVKGSATVVGTVTNNV